MGERIMWLAALGDDDDDDDDDDYDDDDDKPGRCTTADIRYQ
jgi:hypothetical protein